MRKLADDQLLEYAEKEQSKVFKRESVHNFKGNPRQSSTDIKRQLADDQLREYAEKEQSKVFKRESVHKPNVRDIHHVMRAPRHIAKAPIYKIEYAPIYKIECTRYDIVELQDIARQFELKSIPSTHKALTKVINKAELSCGDLLNLEYADDDDAEKPDESGKRSNSATKSKSSKNDANAVVVSLLHNLKSFKSIHDNLQDKTIRSPASIRRLAVDLEAYITSNEFYSAGNLHSPFDRVAIGDLLVLRDILFDHNKSLVDKINTSVDSKKHLPMPRI